MVEKTHIREMGVTKRERKGSVRIWEDVIVDGSDSHWRNKLDSCWAKVEWNSLSESYIDAVIKSWRPPLSQENARVRNVHLRVSEKAKTKKLALLESDLVERPVGTTDPGASRGSIQFMVDCQTLAETTRGATPLRNEFFVPIC